MIGHLTQDAAELGRASAGEQAMGHHRRTSPTGYVSAGVSHSQSPVYCKCERGPWVEDDNCVRCGRFLSPKQLRRARR
jgi:hypothetical protein